MKFDKKAYGYKAEHKGSYEPGDRVQSMIFGYYHGMPGRVIRKSRVQYLDRRGWEYDVLLDNGRTIRLHQNDMEYIGLQSYGSGNNEQD